MALNPVNLQMSVPRVPEASSIQQQAIQRPVMEQMNLEQQAIKQTMENRSQTSKLAETEKSLIRDEEKGKQNSEQNKQQQKQKNEKSDSNTEKQVMHPYKGHSIDIKL